MLLGRPQRWLDRAVLHQELPLTDSRLSRPDGSVRSNPIDYNGRRVWLPRLENLRPGDILLTRSVYGDVPGGDKTARLIRLFTFGRFDHAAICTSPPTLAEAGGGEGGGVFTLSLARCFSHELKNVQVLRWPDGAVAAKAATFCQLQVGRPYSMAKAIASAFPIGGPKTAFDRGVFCSSLVAHAYKIAAPQAFRWMRPDKMSPSGLGRLRGFRDVTRELFKPALAPANVEEMNALDGNPVWTPAYEQTMAALEYATDLLPLTDRFVAGFPEARLRVPATFNDVLAFLPGAWDARNTIAPQRRVAYVHALLEIDAKAAEHLNDGRLTGAVRDMIKLDRAERTRAVAASHSANPDIDLDHQAGLLASRRKSLRDRKAAQTSFQPYAAELASIAIWVALSAETISELEAAMSEQEDILRRCTRGPSVAP